MFGFDDETVQIFTYGFSAGAAYVIIMAYIFIIWKTQSKDK